MERYMNPFEDEDPLTPPDPKKIYRLHFRYKQSGGTLMTSEQSNFTLLMKLSILTHKNPQLNTIIETYLHENPKEINKTNSAGNTALIMALKYFEFSTLETIKIDNSIQNNTNLKWGN